MKYNTTQLSPDNCFERHVYHRDQFAHYLRWTHILKIAKLGQTILDVGCGSGNLLEVFYRNRFKCKAYLGIDIRKQTIRQNLEKFKVIPWATFKAVDICSENFNFIDNYDIITCFEVLEHMLYDDKMRLLTNIKKHMSRQTTCFISTPVYDEKVGAADNHTIDGKVCELTFLECKKMLSSFFDIKSVWGTFASIKDYKSELLKDEKLYEIFIKLHMYFDSNILANLFAPLFPAQARNCLWEVTIK